MSDPHQPGTPAGTDPADIERRAALAEVLGKEVWPADRDTLGGQGGGGERPGRRPRAVAPPARRARSSPTSRRSPRRSAWAPSSSGSDMPSMKEPSPEALANVTEENVETRSHLLPEEQAVEGTGPGEGRHRPEDAGRGDPRRVGGAHGARRPGRRPGRPPAVVGHRRPALTVRHEHPVQLRWSDPDSYGHVNHARALSLLEDARLALAPPPRNGRGGCPTSSWPGSRSTTCASCTTGSGRC